MKARIDPNYDPAHEEDMRQLRREQLESDITPEEAQEYLDSLDDNGEEFDYPFDESDWFED